MTWPLAFALIAGTTAVATMVSVGFIYQPPEPESPQVVCIKARGHWVGGYGRVGWSGICDFTRSDAK